MNFHENASPPKPLVVANLNSVPDYALKVDGSGQHFM